MKKFVFNNWEIEVDVKKTRQFYSRHILITDKCRCFYCKNYVLACDIFPDTIINFFNDLGINMKKEGEVYELARNDDGSRLYGGFYHLVGKILSDNDVWIENRLVENRQFLITNDFGIGFTNKASLVPDNFPEPVLQLEFTANVPWLLNIEF